jgi:ADP-ribosylglycohydrolase
VGDEMACGDRVGMLWGSFVADALSLGPHWVYDIDTLRAHYGSISGYTEPTVMPYHTGRKPGDFTHLGDQSLLLLESIRKRGGFDRDGWAADWLAFFETYDGYFDAATKQTTRHLKAGDPVETAGSDSTELAGAARIAPIAYHYWGKPDQMLAAARAQTDVTHHTTIIVEAAEFIVHTLSAIQDGLRPVFALRMAAGRPYSELPAQTWVEAGIAAAERNSTEAIGEFGRACDIRYSFPSVAQLVARYEDDFRGGLIANVEAGGDSAARGQMLGMILGAYNGFDAIPTEWIDGLTARGPIAAFTSSPTAVGS